MFNPEELEEERQIETELQEKDTRLTGKLIRTEARNVQKGDHLYGDRVRWTWNTNTETRVRHEDGTSTVLHPEETVTIYRPASTPTTEEIHLRQALDDLINGSETV